MRRIEARVREDDMQDETTDQEDETPSDRRLEQETIVRFDETGGAAMLYTASKRVADRLIKAGHSPTRTNKRRGSREVIGWWFSMPTSAVLVKLAGRAVRLGVQRRDPTKERLPATAAQIENLSRARASKQSPQPPDHPPALF